MKVFYEWVSEGFVNEFVMSFVNGWVSVFVNGRMNFIDECGSSEWMEEDVCE